MVTFAGKTSDLTTELPIAKFSFTIFYIYIYIYIYIYNIQKYTHTYIFIYIYTQSILTDKGRYEPVWGIIRSCATWVNIT